VGSPSANFAVKRAGKKEKRRGRRGGASVLRREERKGRWKRLDLDDPIFWISCGNDREKGGKRKSAGKKGTAKNFHLFSGGGKGERGEESGGLAFILKKGRRAVFSIITEKKGGKGVQSAWGAAGEGERSTMFGVDGSISRERGRKGAPTIDAA